MPPVDRELLLKLDELQEAYVVIATQDAGDATRFEEQRRELLDLPPVAALLPEFVHRFRTREQFWQFIKRSFRHYAERRTFIWDGFHAAMEFAEKQGGSPLEHTVEESLSCLESGHIRDLWVKALQRTSGDPEGAITAARTLLESVCKLIMDESAEAYADDATLPKLYSLNAKRLNLAPSQHTEEVFRKILGSCQSIVDGIGAVRNRLSDAHGKGKRPVKPAPRHADLVVNLAGTMAVFLAATWISVRDPVSNE
jgi:hypothetical protein